MGTHLHWDWGAGEVGNSDAPLGWWSPRLGRQLVAAPALSESGDTLAVNEGQAASEYSCSIAACGLHRWGLGSRRCSLQWDDVQLRKEGWGSEIMCKIKWENWCVWYDDFHSVIFKKKGCLVLLTCLDLQSSCRRNKTLSTFVLVGGLE